MSPGPFAALVALAFRQNLAGMRKVGYVVLALVPAAFAALWATLKGDEPDAFFLEYVLGGFHFKLVLPLLGVLVGVDAIHLERQNRTLLYLVTRPVPKPVLYAAKALAATLFAIAVSALTILLAFAVLAIAGGGEFARAALPALGWGLACASLALVVYVALFAAIGAAVPFPLGLSLLVGFLWEGVVSSFRWRFAPLTVVNSARGLLYGAVDATPDFSVGAYPLAGLAVAAAVFLAAGLVSFSLTGYSK